MRYQLIEAEKAQYPVQLMYRLLEVSRSGYYTWCSRPESARALENRRLLVKIRAIHAQHRQRYGSPRIHKALQAQGECVGRHRIARLMRAEGLKPQRQRRFRVTTKADPRLPVAENILDRQFIVSQPNVAWVGDITYIWTAEGWLYLAVLLDLFSRRIVGFAMGRWIDTALCLRALKHALAWREAPVGLVHHTDQGSQCRQSREAVCHRQEALRASRRTYAAIHYQRELATNGLIPSMSRKGNCWDNSVAESFFATLKTELIYMIDFDTREQAQQAIFYYIECYYNQQRQHSTLNYLSPAEFERLQADQINPLNSSVH